MQANLDQRVFWNSVYDNPELQFPDNDSFLSPWIKELKQAKRIVDLGCGNGANTVFLREFGIQTIACDFSEQALKALIQQVPDACVLLFDMADGLPFISNNIDVIIADLSLHYFSLRDTKAILNEIYRCLAPNGLFICRVNALIPTVSLRDFKKIEDDYYDIDGCKKRFFTIRTLTEMMRDFKIKRVFEQETFKYRNRKKTIVCEAYKSQNIARVDSQSDCL